LVNHLALHIQHTRSGTDNRMQSSVKNKNIANLKLVVWIRYCIGSWMGEVSKKSFYFCLKWHCKDYISVALVICLGLDERMLPRMISLRSCHFIIFEWNVLAVVPACVRTTFSAIPINI
jgi:hypothetical protein